METLSCITGMSGGFFIHCIRDITYKTPENFFGHLVALDHEIGGIFARSVHVKLPEKFSGHLVVSFSRETSSNTYFYKKKKRK